MEQLTERENAILRVLYKRVDCCETSIVANRKEIEKRQKQIDYLRAKKEGYMQTIELLKEPIESIRVEL